MNYFQMGTQIISGNGALNALKDMDMTSVLIICDPYMVESNKVEDIATILVEKGVTFNIFSDIIPDPTIEVVVQGVGAISSCQADTIIAFGGGSAIDSAKAIKEVYSQSSTQRIQLIAIPTTSGTGSEVTAFSVISDSQKAEKYALVDASMIPDVAILEPKLTETVPSHITADTGVDVMTHCFEAYVSLKATDFTDACAEKGLRIAWENLVQVVEHGEDSFGREKLLNASCLAGIAFNEASLGICHSLAHALGAKFHIPHGRANALLLPHVIAYNAGMDLNQETETLLKYESMAKLLGIQSGTKRGTVQSMIAQLNRQTKRMGIPKYVTDCGVEKEAFVNEIPEMARLAMADTCTLTNPRIPTSKELEQIYLQLCQGGY
ncbi:1-propanol dehydrogenase PduQ [Vagococcus fluvialis]|uniref:1-propanol dehydrogenase PduQ n=1 Tax=Vagococcus fluvialis TaxID=2738 RepID=UPI003B5CE5FD